MKKLLFILLVLIIYTAPITKFFFSIGFRIQYCEFLALIFIVLSFLDIYVLKSSLTLHPTVSIYNKLNWLFLIPVVFSLASFIFFPKTFKELGYFVKGFLSLVTFLLFLNLLSIVFKQFDSNQKNILVNSFIFSIFLSSLYGILQIILIVFYQVDIDQIISGLLPFTDAEINFADSALGSFYRLNGFSFDPSVQASFSIFVIILLIYRIFVSGKISYIIPLNIIFLAFMMTMSGSAGAGLLTALAILIFWNIRKLKLRTLIFGSIILIPVVIFYFVFQEEILFFAEHKFQSDGTTSTHTAIALNALTLGVDYPLTGIGYNNFSYAYEKFFFESNYNAHNSWLNFFVETGILGIICKLIFTICIIVAAYLSKSKFSLYFIAGFIGVNVASLGYEVLNLFFNQLMIFTLFIVMVEGKSKEDILIRESVF